MSLDEELQALRQGRALADLSGWRKVRVRGADAPGWLSDLLTAELRDLAEGEARPALLLTPTGRIRAAVTCARVDGELLLVQDPQQPTAIDVLISPYVLSSDVELEDVTNAQQLFAFLGTDDGVPATRRYAPSALGAGIDLLVSQTAEVPVGRTLVGVDALDRWRVERGVAVFPVDLGPDSLPHEASYEHAIEEHKGCYLGQEAVAKVRNLGHPPWLVLAVRTSSPTGAGDAVTAGDGESGRVTSAAGEHAIVRVRWAAREQALRTASGAEIEVLGPARGAP